MRISSHGDGAREQGSCIKHADGARAVIACGFIMEAEVPVGASWGGRDDASGVELEAGRICMSWICTARLPYTAFSYGFIPP